MLNWTFLYFSLCFFASCPVTGYHWEEAWIHFPSSLPTFQLFIHIAKFFLSLLFSRLSIPSSLGFFMNDSCSNPLLTQLPLPIYFSPVSSFYVDLLLMQNILLMHILDKTLLRHSWLFGNPDQVLMVVAATCRKGPWLNVMWWEMLTLFGREVTHHKLLGVLWRYSHTNIGRKVMLFVQWTFFLKSLVS